jgi:hypothetical protein
MNERIRELVRQAGLDDADFPIENWDNVPLAKFAQLIIEQLCYDIMVVCGESQVERIQYVAKDWGVEL